MNWKSGAFKASGFYIFNMSKYNNYFNINVYD